MVPEERIRLVLLVLGRNFIMVLNKKHQYQQYPVLVVTDNM